MLNSFCSEFFSSFGNHSISFASESRHPLAAAKFLLSSAAWDRSTYLSARNIMYLWVGPCAPLGGYPPGASNSYIPTNLVLSTSSVTWQTQLVD